MQQIIYETSDEEGSYSFHEKALAWFAHLFTASGAIWGLLAMLAVTNEQWILAFAWMSAAVLVDSLDGFLARRLRVKEVLPEFDGALLDNMVDFLNYVFVPAFFIYQADFLPPVANLIGPVLILLASSYQFCQNDTKTEDHYFKGFPSYWNIMVYYMFILELNGWVNFAIIVLLSILVFVPIKYVYPSRTAMRHGLTLTLATIWGIITVVILVQYPNQSPWLVWVSLLFAVYYIGISLYSMIRPTPAA